MPAFLADANAGDAGRNKIEDCVADQPVEDDNVGLPDQPERLDGQEIRITGTGPHQVNAADSLHDRPSKIREIGRLQKNRAGFASRPIRSKWFI